MSYWILSLAGVACLTVAALPKHTNNMERGSVPAKQWDWTGIIGTGQSLSVGARAMPVKSTGQPYGNMKLSTGNLPWPVDPDAPSLHLEPLIEPIGRIAPNYPSSWPENIDGETPHTAASIQISALSQANDKHAFVTVHSAVGEDGQGMIYLKKNPEKKGLNGRSYEAALIETKAITRLAKAANKSYGVGAIFVTHGETDCGNVNYGKELYQLWNDYNTDLRAITGQMRPILMIVSQQNSIMDHAPSTLAQWRAGTDHPTEIVCSGPKYQYPYVADAVHLNAEGYQLLGEKYGEVFYERFVLGHNWQPLQPIGINRTGQVIVVKFHVPNKALTWDTTFETPHAATPEWKNGKGFEVVTSNGDKVKIESVEISRGGDQVVVTCASDPGPNAKISYAMVAEKAARKSPSPGTTRWGLLRDSDASVGVTSKQKLPNYCVAFELALP